MSKQKRKRLDLDSPPKNIFKKIIEILIKLVLSFFKSSSWVAQKIAKKTHPDFSKKDSFLNQTFVVSEMVDFLDVKLLNAAQCPIPMHPLVLQLSNQYSISTDRIVKLPIKN